MSGSVRQDTVAFSQSCEPKRTSDVDWQTRRPRFGGVVSEGASKEEGSICEQATFCGQSSLALKPGGRQMERGSPGYNRNLQNSEASVFYLREINVRRMPALEPLRFLMWSS